MLTCDPPAAPATSHAEEVLKHQEDQELFVCPFVVAVDTREQAPWTFQQIVIEKRLWLVKRVVQTLQTGDYSIQGQEQSLVIERKSAEDLVASVTAGNKRFRAEHERMRDVVKFGQPDGGFACVIVEGSLATICEQLDSEPGRRVTSETILGATASWPMRYQTPWFYAGDRRHAELLAMRIMVKWWKQHAEK